MNHINVGMLAAISCFGWIGMFVAKKKINLFTGNCLGLVYHLALLPVVASLPAPDWIKAAGFFWVLCDALIDVASINKMSEENVWALRMGVHIPASIWIFGTASSMSFPGLAIGYALSLLLATHAIIGPYIPKSKMVLFVFVLPLMSAWLLIISLKHF
ncbi:MAG: hypothetical protein WA160_16755 [Pseudobdellovibrio sp.]